MQQLEDDGLLSFDAERIDRVEEIHTQLLTGLVDHAEALIEVAPHQKGSSAVRQRLRERAADRLLGLTGGAGFFTSPVSSHEDSSNLRVSSNEVG